MTVLEDERTEVERGGAAPAPAPGWTDGAAALARITALGEVLRQGAADLAAAEHRWLVALEEFDRLGGWAEQGARTCAHWLSWACGVGLDAGRERLRVARALPHLPAISQELAHGRISYSKVRAITRIATPATDALLASYARSSTASQLERVVREHRRQEGGADAAATGRLPALSWRTREDGWVRFTADYPPEAAAAIIARLTEEVDALGEDQPPPAAPAQRHPHPADERRALAEAGAPDTDAGVDPWTGPPPLAVRRAEALARMAASARLADGPADDAHRVVLHVRQAGAGSASGPSHWDAHLEDGSAIPAATAQRLACDASTTTLVEDALGMPIGVGRRTRRIPGRLRTALRARDGGCRFPSCTATRWVDAHHVVFWSEGGATEPDNLVLLCRHHHRLVHEGGYRVTAHPGQRFAFHRPDGARIPEALLAPAGDPDAPRAANRAAGRLLGPDDLIPDWDGRPPDYDAALEVLAAWSAADPPEEPAEEPAAAVTPGRARPRASRSAPPPAGS